MAFTMIYNGEETISAYRGVKGDDYVRLFDDEDNVVFEATGVSDFSVFEVIEGVWRQPWTKSTPVVTATKVQFYDEDGAIEVRLPHGVVLTTGLTMSFIAPCDCSTAGGIAVNGQYPEYEIVDAMGNVMTGGSGVWCSGSLITVVLDVENKKAYIQNSAHTKSRTYTATLSTTWTAAGTVYYQDVTVAGITEADDPIVDFVPQTNNATNVTLSGEMSKIFRVDTYEDSITVWASEKPTVSLPIRLKVV